MKIIAIVCFQIIHPIRKKRESKPWQTTLGTTFLLRSHHCIIPRRWNLRTHKSQGVFLRLYYTLYIFAIHEERRLRNNKRFRKEHSEEMWQAVHFVLGDGKCYRAFQLCKWSQEMICFLERLVTLLCSYSQKIPCFIAHSTWMEWTREWQYNANGVKPITRG